MNFHTQPTKISGVNFPPGCPRDFADQVRMMVRRHNQTVEDLITYGQTVRELESINTDIRRQLNKQKISHSELQGRYDTLKNVSEKLAAKYEKLVGSRNGALPQSSRLSESIRDMKSQKINVEKDSPQSAVSTTSATAQLSDDEKLSSVKTENSTSEKLNQEEEDDDEELVEIETETATE
jgi:hypothetical protein